MRRALIPLAALCLAGCAATYSKPGSTELDFDRDTYECEVGGTRPGPMPAFYPNASPNTYTNLAMASQGLTNASNSLYARAHEMRLFDKCMRVKGWTKE